MENKFLKPSTRLRCGEFEAQEFEKVVRLHYDGSKRELNVSKISK